MEERIRSEEVVRRVEMEIVFKEKIARMGESLRKSKAREQLLQDELDAATSAATANVLWTAHRCYSSIAVNNATFVFVVGATTSASAS
eukprot:SAG31_NODE_988_length_10542_cov_52.848319_6_plen_88_part_00